MSNYLIVSPVKNEEHFIEKTIQSVIHQTVLPKKWIIVDDGSTDGTAEIVRQYAQDYQFLTLLRREHLQKREPGKNVIEAFNAGLSLVNVKDFDFVCKLDGDLILPVDFFEKALLKFEQYPTLGLTSGMSVIKKGDTWIAEKAAKQYTFGSSKIYRLDCFKDIGGLLPVMGWDGIDHVKAVMHGWTARSFDDLIQYHLRPTSEANGLVKAAFQEGVCCYYMGYHPLFFLLRSTKKMFSSPYFILGMAMILSYIKCALKQDVTIDDDEFKRYLRKSQLARLMFKRQSYV